MIFQETSAGAAMDTSEEISVDTEEELCLMLAHPCHFDIIQKNTYYPSVKKISNRWKQSKADFSSLWFSHPTNLWRETHQLTQRKSDMTANCLKDVTSSPASQAAERHIHLTMLSYPRWSWFLLPPHNPNVLLKCGGQMIFLFI